MGAWRNPAMRSDDIFAREGSMKLKVVRERGATPLPLAGRGEERSRQRSNLMQLRRLQEARAVARLHAGLDGLAVAVDRHWNFKPCRAERPDLAIEPGKIA